jgi:hypothetical protein
MSSPLFYPGQCTTILHGTRSLGLMNGSGVSWPEPRLSEDDFKLQLISQCHLISVQDLPRQRAGEGAGR